AGGRQPPRCTRLRGDTLPSADRRIVRMNGRIANNAGRFIRCPGGYLDEWADCDNRQEAGTETSVGDPKSLGDALPNAVVATIVTAVVLGIADSAVTADETPGPLPASYRLQTLIGIAALTLVAGALGTLLGLPAWLRQAISRCRASLRKCSGLPD